MNKESVNPIVNMGHMANAAFYYAKALLAEGKAEEALSVPGLLPSDRRIIERRIAASANGNDQRSQ